jgi:hypothetical protein
MLAVKWFFYNQLFLQGMFGEGGNF